MQEIVPTARPAAPPSPPTDSEDHILAKETYSLDFDMKVFSFFDNEDGDAPKAAAEQPSAADPSATVPSASPKPTEVLQELTFMLKRPAADITTEKKLPSIISSILGEAAEEDQPALGKLGSLQQVVTDAAAAKERATLRKQREQNERALHKLDEEAKANKERA